MLKVTVKGHIFQSQEWKMDDPEPPKTVVGAVQYSLKETRPDNIVKNKKQN